MKRSSHHKLRQLVASLLMGIVGPILLLFLFNHPASLETATYLAGWGAATLFIWFSWRRRSALWPWRYALSVAAGLALLLQFSVSWLQPLPEAHAAGIEVTTLTDEFNGGGACSLREAIRSANTDTEVGGCAAGSGVDIITFHPISAAGTIILTQTGVISDEDGSASGDLDITESVQIVGLGTMTTTIDASGLVTNSNRVFHILASSGTIEFSDLTIQGGSSDGDGGGIFNQDAATVVLDNVTVQDNEVTGLGEDGGGIANTGGGTVNIINGSVIDSNRVTNTGVTTDSNVANGGGVFNLGSGSIVNITNVSITNNEAVEDGGGVYNFGGATANITQTTIIGNMAMRDGGGIYNTDGSSVVNLVESTVSDNIADRNAGGIYSSQEFNISQSTISGNTADQNGGGIYNVGTMSITDGTISGNTATNSDGGGIANADDTLIINSSVISDNKTSNAADGDGGGIAARRLGIGTTTTVNNSLIVNNQSEDDGGGLSNEEGAVLTINTSVISGNITSDNGGGVFNTDGDSTVNIIQSTLRNNTASGLGSAPTGQGGGLFSDGIAVVEISTVSGNTAAEGGGVAANFDGAQIGLNGVTVADNEATTRGGGIFRGNAQLGGVDTGGGTLGFVNSLIADNTAPNDPDCSDQGGAPSPATLVSGGHNLIGDETGCSGLQSSDLVGADPRLGPLDNNGFSTPTHALLIGSEAIDAGDDVACTSTDQRLESRVDQDGVGATTCDIGAFEFTDTVAVPALAINDVTAEEGDSGPQTMSFEVMLTGPQPFTATVDYAIGAGTAIGNVDYVDTSGTLIFAPTVQTGTIDVTINGDNTPEMDETFTVNLSNANWATIADDQGLGTITNDDIGVSISDAEVTEGDEGLTDVMLDVTLSLAPDTTVTVDYNTAPGMGAEEDVDYVSSSGTVTFTSGITQQQITVQVIGDTVPDEGDEFFFVNLETPSGGASLIKGLGQVTIRENDFTDFPVFLPLVIK